MNVTKKEQDFLKDLQKEEKLCIEKYSRAAQDACDEGLKQIFTTIGDAEQKHYDTITSMLKGDVPPQQSGSKQSKQQSGSKQSKQPDLKSTANAAGKKKDAYLLADLLGTEKYVSSVYNTAVFEFTDEAARQTLAGIQQTEQQHGKQLYDYMAANGMYA